MADIAEKWRLILSNGVLTRRCLHSQAHLKDTQENSADLQLELTKAQLLELMRGNGVADVRQSGRTEVLE